MIDPIRLRSKISEDAEREALAQLKVIRALNKLKDGEQVHRVLGALGHILEADRLVPGIFQALGSVGKKGVQGKENAGVLPLTSQRKKAK